MFFRASHQHIYQAMLRLNDLGKPIDPGTVLETIRTAGALEEVGGETSAVAFLNDMRGSMPSAFAGPSNAHIVRKHAIKRDLYFEASDLAKMAQDETVGLVQLAQEADRVALNVDSMLRVGGVDKSADVAMDVVDTYLETKQVLEETGRVVPGISSGFADIDVYTSGWREGQLIILGARPGQGKTALGLEFGLNCAYQHLAEGGPVLFVTTEMTRRQLMQRAVCNRARIDYKDLLMGKLNKDDEARMEEVAEDLGDVPFYMNDRFDVSVSEVISMISYAVSAFGVKLVVVDYLQNLRKPPRANDYEHITHSTKRLKQAALKWNIPVIALAQLNREADAGPRKKKQAPVKPRLSNLKGSGEIEQAADVAMLMHYPAVRSYVQPVVLIIDKNRDHPTGEISLTFHKRYSSFEIPQEEDNAEWQHYSDADDDELEQLVDELVEREKKTGKAEGGDGTQAAPGF